MARIEELAAKVDEARDLQQKEALEIRHILLGAFMSISARAPRKPMRDVAPLVRRQVEVDPLGTYHELGIRSFVNGTFHKPALSGSEIGEKRVFRIEPGDLLFSNVFAWEGAIAVAKQVDAGRIGSHRFISCVPRTEIANAEFLRFYFLTDEGLGKIGVASLGGAGRNCTLSLAALAAIEVPVPAMCDQRWFEALQVKTDTLNHLRAETAAELDALLPSILDRAFRGEL